MLSHNPAIFQIIDQKLNCDSIYYNNKIEKEPQYDLMTHTWSYNNSLKNSEIEFLELYTQGKKLDECCPVPLKKRWEELKQKHLVFMKSFDIAKVQAKDYCFYDLVPESFIINYFKIKTEITKHVLDTTVKPQNYDFLLGLSDLIYQIEQNKLDIETSELSSDLHNLRARKFKEKLLRLQPYVSYNLFGTITGRLTTKKDSFPLLTLDKNYRKIIKPKNSWFLELDFNAAELRCLLSLNKQPQPKEDIHQWHGKILTNLFNKEMERDEIKRKIFGWLYGPENVSLGIPKIEEFYNKKNVIEKYWNGHEIVNPFGRKIVADRFHALNAIIQSTTSDTFLRRAIAVNKLLEGRKSFTMGLIHDSMVIDFDRDDKELIEDLIKEFGNTDLGEFKVNASLGTNFGNMRKFR